MADLSRLPACWDSVASSARGRLRAGPTGHRRQLPFDGTKILHNGLTRRLYVSRKVSGIVSSAAKWNLSK